MAIGPKEIFDSVTENEQRIIDEIEDRIDARLAKAKEEADTTVRKFSIDVGDLKISSVVERIIKQKYTATGWKKVTLRRENFRNENEVYVDLEA